MFHPPRLDNPDWVFLKIGFGPLKWQGFPFGTRMIRQGFSSFSVSFCGCVIIMPTSWSLNPPLGEHTVGGEILHHCEIMDSYYLLVFAGGSFQGFLGGAKWILSIHSRMEQQLPAWPEKRMGGGGEGRGSGRPASWRSWASPSSPRS